MAGEPEIDNEIPFDMSKETLKSIRSWIDKITQLSVGIFGGVKIPNNEMITVKKDMVRQLIVLASPMIQNDIEEIEEFFEEINLSKGDFKLNGIWNRGVIIYSTEANNLLDECVKGIQKALKKYFIPTIQRGEN